MSYIKLGYIKVWFFKKVLRYLKIYASIERVFNNDIILSVRNFLKQNRPITTEHDLIRIGGSDDGGYLIPNDLIGIKYCFSPGVDITSDFEYHLYKKYNIHSYLSDFSVDKPGINCEGFKFQKKYLNSKTDSINDTLTDWIRKEKNDNDMILQMDIEGFEYDVLIETPQDILKKFRIILVEFHNLKQIFSQFGLKMIKSIFDKSELCRLLSLIAVLLISIFFKFEYVILVLNKLLFDKSLFLIFVKSTSRILVKERSTLSIFVSFKLIK